MRRSGNGSGRGKRCGRLKGCDKEGSKGRARGIEIELMRWGMSRVQDPMVERTKMILSRVEKRRMRWMMAVR